MSIVIVALLPCIFMAMYNTGYQAQKLIAAEQAAVPTTSSIFDAIWSGNWRFDVLHWFGILNESNVCSDPGTFLSPWHHVWLFGSRSVVLHSRLSRLHDRWWSLRIDFQRDS